MHEFKVRARKGYTRLAPAPPTPSPVPTRVSPPAPFAQMQWEEEHAGQKALLAQRERELAQQAQLLQHQRETYTQQQQEVRLAALSPSVTLHLPHTHVKEIKCSHG